MNDIFFLMPPAVSADEFVYFRKSFTVGNLPKTAVIRMLSEGHSALFVNGKFVECCQGRHPGRVAAFDILPYIKRGKNVLAFKLGGDYFQTFEKSARKLIKESNSMLAFSLDLGRKRINSDSSVLCSTSRSDNWCGTDFDDSSWVNAEPIMHVGSEDIANCWKPAPVWKLQPEKILVPEKKLHMNIYDFGKTVVGYPELHFKSGFGEKIILYFDLYETTKELENSKTVIQNLTVEAVIPPDGKVRIYRRRAMRYLRVVSDTGLVPSYIGVHQSTYPADFIGKFHCSDELLNKIDETAEYTLRVNMHQEFESCPRWEMLGFSGDVRMCGLLAACLYGDTALAKAFFTIKHGMNAILTPGHVYSRSEERGLWDYPAWYVIMVLDYVYWTGDLRTAKKLWNSVEMNADWYADKLNPDGLIYQPLLHDDHRRGFSIVDYTCSGNRTGYKVFLNALAGETFHAAAQLAELLGKQKKSDRFNSLADKTRGAVSSLLWDNDLHTFRDKGKPYVSQDGNALAVLFGAASPEQKHSALLYLKNSMWSEYGSAMADRAIDTEDMEYSNFKGSEVISPLMNTYEAEAHFKYGSPDDALELIRRTWGGMLKKGAKTFWEYAWNDAEKPWNLTCHAWSAGTAYLMRAYVCGIKPSKPGFEEISLCPRPGSLESFDAVIPTPLGNITVGYKNKTFTLTCPEGIKAVHANLPEGTVLKRM